MSGDATSRRARGEGTIFHDEERERWIGQIDLGLGPDGRRRRRKVSGRTRAETARKLRELRRAEDRPSGAHCCPSISRLAAQSGSRPEGALDAVAPQITRRARHNPGDRHHRRRSAPARAHRGLAGCGRSSGQGKADDCRLPPDAERDPRLVRASPAHRLEPGTGSRTPTRCSAPGRKTLTRGQVASLLEALAHERLGPYFTVLLLCGVRPGEADALAWAAIDFDARTVHVAYALQRGDGGQPLAIGTTKSKRVRTLALPAAAIEALHRQRAQQEADRLAGGSAYSDSWPGLVFLSEVGTPLHPFERPADLPQRVRTRRTAPLHAVRDAPLRCVAARRGRRPTVRGRRRPRPCRPPHARAALSASGRLRGHRSRVRHGRARESEAVWLPVGLPHMKRGSG
jgi:hypothetical protein